MRVFPESFAKYLSDRNIFWIDDGKSDKILTLCSEGRLKFIFEILKWKGWYAYMSEIVYWIIQNGSENGANIPPTHKKECY